MKIRFWKPFGCEWYYKKTVEWDSNEQSITWESVYINFFKSIRGPSDPWFQKLRYDGRVKYVFFFGKYELVVGRDAEYQINLYD